MAIPIASVSCSEEEKKCSVWWLQSRENKTVTVRVDIPIEDARRVLKKSHPVELENELDELLRNSKAELE
ncbi:MAG: hypothetical protein DRP14_04305 [Candidatus Aenigmatarchaeota archaeon]|nr:MAG: hypothetical protein DRP14_04305 [Candidatus Aenigmarchaeota archaeon]